MKLQRQLSDGRLVSMELPVEALPASTTAGVLMLDSTEIEIVSGDLAAVTFYLTANQTQPDNFHIVDGHTVRWGSFYGDVRAGIGWAVELGKWWAYGHIPPTISEAGLMTLLNSARWEGGEAGIRISPIGGVNWSPFRFQRLMQGLPGLGMLDLRTALRDRSPRQASGSTVAGGELYRSGVEEAGAYLILDTGKYLGYFSAIDPSHETLDKLTELASLTVVE